MTASVLNFASDSKGYNAYAPSFSEIRYSATLTTGAASTITVSSAFETWIAVFCIQPGCNVWVANNASAAIPVVATFATTTSELNPGARRVVAGDVLSLITDNMTADVGVMLYPIQE